MNDANVTYSSVPSTLSELPGYRVDCPCGRQHGIDTRVFVLETGGLSQLSSVVEMHGERQRIGLLVDRTTWKIAGEEVTAILSRKGRSVIRHQLVDEAGGRPHATWENVSIVKNAFLHCELVVALGSGTINDLAKLASYLLGVDYLVIPTAPSMNGYTSAIAAIMKDGLKCTIECHQPFGVVGDVDLLCTAPAQMVAAGIGDLESKPVCTADFKLSSLIRGTYYCPVPGAMVSAAERKAALTAKGLAAREKSAITALSEALLLSGCSMKMAGSSSPASGAEHLISHYWDMTAARDNRIEGFHGAQVGVASLVMAALYEVLARWDVSAFDIEARMAVYPQKAQVAQRIRATHGEWAEDALNAYLEKYLPSCDARPSILKTTRRWDDIWKELGTLRPASDIRQVLVQAGAPVTMEALGLGEAHLREAFMVSREIRGRYTVLDFAFELGLLETCMASVFDMSRVLER